MFQCTDVLNMVHDAQLHLMLFFAAVVTTAASHMVSRHSFVRFRDKQGRSETRSCTTSFMDISDQRVELQEFPVLPLLGGLRFTLGSSSDVSDDGGCGLCWTAEVIDLPVSGTSLPSNPLSTTSMRSNQYSGVTVMPGRSCSGFKYVC